MPSSKPRQPQYPFHNKTVIVTNCGRFVSLSQEINLSTCLAGQAVCIKEVEDGIGLVSFMHYGLRYVLLPMSRDGQSHALR
jgi:hypothetical protein